MSATASTLSHLLNGIYGAAIAPEQWLSALQQIADAVGGSTSGIVVHNQTTGLFPLAYTDWRAPDDGLQVYFDHYGQRDPLRESANRRIGEVLTDEQLVTPQIMRSETYNDFYVRFGLSRSLGYVWRPSEDQLASLVIYKSAARGTFSAADGELLSLLLPHVERAVKITSALGTAVVEAASWRAVLDRFRSPVFLVTSACRLLGCNSSGASLLSHPDGLVASKGDLSGTQSRDSIALRQLVTKTTSGEVPGCPGQIQLSRPSGKSPLLVSAAPHRVGGQLCALLVIVDPTEMPNHLQDHLRARFGMTRAEALIALRIASGATLAAIAEERGSSLNTVRTQLKQVLQKAGARTQAGLVRAILQDPATTLVTAEA